MKVMKIEFQKKVFLGKWKKFNRKSNIKQKYYSYYVAKVHFKSVLPYQTTYLKFCLNLLEAALQSVLTTILQEVLEDTSMQGMCFRCSATVWQHRALTLSSRPALTLFLIWESLPQGVADPWGSEIFLLFLILHKEFIKCGLTWAQSLLDWPRHLFN